MDVIALPFNAAIGLQRAAGGALMLPADPRYTNHLGTVHAGALLTLAEAASGDCLQREFGGIGFAVVPVVRRMEAKFRRPAQGAVFARAAVAPAAQVEFATALAAKGRALIAVAAEVTDAQGMPVLAAAVEWFVARRE